VEVELDRLAVQLQAVMLIFQVAQVAQIEVRVVVARQATQQMEELAPLAALLGVILPVLVVVELVCMGMLAQALLRAAAVLGHHKPIIQRLLAQPVPGACRVLQMYDLAQAALEVQVALMVVVVEAALTQQAVLVVGNHLLGLLGLFGMVKHSQPVRRNNARLG